MCCWMFNGQAHLSIFFALHWPRLICLSSLFISLSSKLLMHELMEEKNFMQFPFLPAEAHDMPPWNGTKTFSTSSQAVAQASLSIHPNAYPHRNSLTPMQVQDHSTLTPSITSSRMLKANNYYHFFQISTRPASIAVVCVNRACQPSATRLSPPLQT